MNFALISLLVLVSFPHPFHRKPAQLNMMKILEMTQDGIDSGCSSLYLSKSECIHVTGIIDASRRDASQDRPKAVILGRIVAEEGKLQPYSKERPYLDWLVRLLYKD